MRRSLLFLIVSFSLLAFLVDSYRSPSHAQRTPAVQQKQAKAKGVWPYLSEKTATEKISDNPLAKNYVLIFDGSGSMSETECAGSTTKAFAAKLAVKAWSNSVPRGSNVGLVAFYGVGRWAKRPLASGQADEFAKVVNGLHPGGRTPLGEAVAIAYDMLTRQARLQLGYGEYNIVVVTDGKASDPKTLVRWVTHILDNSPIIIHTIGFCIGERHTLNQKGRTIYRTANNPQQLRKGLQEVLAEAEAFDVSDFAR